MTKKVIMEELKKASRKYRERAMAEDKKDGQTHPSYAMLREAFENGAEWKEAQMENNRIAACVNISRDEYEREKDFVHTFIKLNKRAPTYSDAIEITRKETIKKACEAYCIVCDTKDCEEWDIECNWVKKFKKAML